MEKKTFIHDPKDKMLVIIIAVLSVILIALLIFFLIERSENKEHIAAIEQEKVGLEQELTDFSQN